MRIVVKHSLWGVRSLELDWDTGTYRMVFPTHHSKQFWMSEIADLISEEFLEWAPDR